MWCVMVGNDFTKGFFAANEFIERRLLENTHTHTRLILEGKRGRGLR